MSVGRRHVNRPEARGIISIHSFAVYRDDAWQVTVLNLQALRREEVSILPLLETNGLQWEMVLYRCMSLLREPEELRIAIVSRNSQPLNATYSFSILNHADVTQSYVANVACLSCPYHVSWYTENIRFDVLTHPEAGFCVDNAITIWFRVSNVAPPSPSWSNYLAPGRSLTLGDDTNPINREILSSDSIKEYLEDGCLPGIASDVQRRSGLFFYNEKIHPFWTEDRDYRLWRCQRHADGTISILGCLNDVDENARFGDICHNSGGCWITLYLEKCQEGKALVPVTPNTLLIFCKLYLPQEERFEFSGHILIDEMKRCSELFSQLADKIEYPDARYCTFYVEEDGGYSLRKVNDRSASLSENGLGSGSVIVVFRYIDDPRHIIYPYTTDDDIGNRPQTLSDDEDSLLSYDDEIAGGDLCVLCMDAPIRAGFVHGTSSHRCICRECAELWLEENRDGRCPICRARIDRILLDMY